MPLLNLVALSSVVPSAVGLTAFHQSSGSLGGVLATVEESCVSLSAGDEATFFTAPIKLGDSGTQADIVVDTGSTQLLVQSSKATSTTQHTGKETVLSYGSGDVMVEECTDTVEFAGEVHDETIYLMEEYSSSAFASIEGILPLSMEQQNIIHSTSFSLCMSQTGGALNLHSSGASISANTRWEIALGGVSVDGASTGISGGEVLPDSGTTLLLGPLDGLEKLFATACSQWSACAGSDATAFVTAIESLGGDCSSTAPDISFSLGGETVSVTASSYIMKWQGMCYPAFDYMDYDDLWILGLPLFFDNEVSFDVASSKVGFAAGTCGGCSGGLAQRHQSKKSVREIFGNPRQPTVKRSGAKLNAVNKRSPAQMKLATKLDARQFKKA